MSSSGQSMTSYIPNNIKLGIIGGSGMCTFPELSEVSQEVIITTKYGSTSDKISICEYGGQKVAFLPRHGKKHTIAPHNVPYRANIAAMKELGVQYLIGTCIVGSLKKEICPGTLIIPDQFVNLTWGRDDYSLVDGSSFIHLPMGEPYCQHVREKLIEHTKLVSSKVLDTAIVAVIQGPRFSTRAESSWLSSNGWDIVNMTQYPECYFAREFGICYGAIASVTDYDVGLHERITINPQNMESVLEVFKNNILMTKKVLLSFVGKSIPVLSCGCAAMDIRMYYQQ